MLFVKILLMIWLFSLGMIFYKSALENEGFGVWCSLIMAIMAMVGICLL